MNLKRISIIFIASLILILTIGVISASEDVQTNETLASNEASHVIGDENIGNQTPAEGNQTPVEPVIIPKIKTKVQADQKAAVYKKDSYFKIKLTDNKNSILKNVKLKVKVKSDKMVKTFFIKTNSKGIAKFNTNGFKIGTYKVTITSADERYNVSKKSKLFVGKLYKTVLRFGRLKMLKNNETIKFKVKYDADLGKEVTIVFTKKAIYTKILKAKFVFYKPSTRGLISKMEYSKFKNDKWHWPDKDYTFKYLIYYARVYYISTIKC